MVGTLFSTAVLKYFLMAQILNICDFRLSKFFKKVPSLDPISIILEFEPKNFLHIQNNF